MENILGDNIKKSWYEVTIENYLMIYSIENSKMLSFLEKRLNILAVLTGKHINELRELKSEEIDRIFEKDLAFLKTEIKGELKDYYFVAGRKYKLIEQIDDFTAGQFIDHDNYKKGKDNVLDLLHLVLTVVLIPVKELTPEEVCKNRRFEKLSKYKWGKKYLKARNWNYNEGTLEKYMETDVNLTSEIFYKHFPITSAMAINEYFFLLRKIFSIYIQLYLTDQKKKSLQSLNSHLKILKKENKDPQKIQQLQEAVDFMTSGSGSF